MKTAEEIYEDNGCNSKRDIIEAMKEYANQKLDEAAEKAKVKKLKLVHNNITKYVYVVESQSILELKDKL